MAEQKEKEIKVTGRKEKVSDKHLSILQSLVNTINSIQFNVGQMEVQKQVAIDELKKTQRKVSDMQTTLVSEYGSYDINIHDGTINWPKPKTEPNGEEKPEGDEK
tara:strand:- start:1486 stop:1800 length:315 start_codon:yes stop_codon:yes gene_type:complete